VPDKDEFSQSKRQMMARIDVCMGGKVAEEVIFGRDFVTSGARSDLQQATSLARHMVTECGMSDELGRLAFFSVPVPCYAAQHFKLCSQFTLGSMKACAKGSYSTLLHLLFAGAMHAACATCRALFVCAFRESSLFLISYKNSF